MASKGDKAKTGKKRRFFQNIADSYRIAKRSYPLIGWYLLGLTVVMIALAVLYGFYFSSWISAVIFGIGLILVADMFLLGVLVRRASYMQIAGTPGAAGAVLGQIPRGWVVEQNPVAVNQHTKDLVFRCIGRCGVVLVTEGPTSRVAKMVEEQRRVVTRVAPGVPVHVINTGKEEGQVPLEKLLRRINKFKRQLTAAEVNEVATRLSTVGGLNVNIPKGIDPQKQRFSRRATIR